MFEYASLFMMLITEFAQAAQGIVRQKWLNKYKRKITLV